MSTLVILSRIQFALTISFHYLFPIMSIGLVTLIVIMEGIYLKTKKPIWKEMTQFWTKIFALSFALGVASGIVQVFAFGNNWANFSRFAGDVFGSALAAEGIFAFFLEAGFIGLMLFGWNRVKPGMHYFATLCVAFGAHFSAIWIVAVNSWMQTPAGFKIVGEGDQSRAIVTHFWQMIFNPSFLDRLTHVLIGAWLTGAFILLSVCAFYYLKNRHMEHAKRGMKLGLIVAGFMLIAQLFSADSTARGVAKNQPEKLAALEGIYHTEDYTPMTLIGWVDKNTKEVKGIKVPALLSFLVYRNFKQAVPGLNNFPEEDWPNVQVVFQTYHIMIYMWCAMVLAALLGGFFWWRKTLERSKWTLRLLVISVAFPYIANEIGWYTAEMGRQPWIIYHIMRTTQGVSRSIVPSQVVGSLIMFAVIYSLLFALFIFLFNRKIQLGPGAHDQEEDARVYRDPYAKQPGDNAQ